MTSSPSPTTYERLADLPVVIDGYALDGLSRRVSTGFRRFTTVFRLAGGGHDGVGEDVTYEAAEPPSSGARRTGVRGTAEKSSGVRGIR